MARAIFNGTVIAESAAVEIVEDNVYFPPEAIRRDLFQDTEHSTICGWKGTASYYTVAVDGETGENIAWTYRSPNPEAENIKNCVAFYPAVTVER